MPAYFDTGFFARVPAWHGEGNVTDREAATWDEAREWGGLQWEPIEAPSFGFRGIVAETGETVNVPGDGVVGDYFADEGFKRIIRSDTGKLLTTAKDSYTLITHAEMGEIADAIMGQGLKVETAGATHGGKRVWGLFLLDEPQIITSPSGRTDMTATLPYMPVMNSHDGSGSCRVGFTQVRIVCANTWQSSEAEQERHGRTYLFRHTANWKDRVEEARLAVQGQREAIEHYHAVMGDLLDISVTAAQRELFVREFVPMPPEGLISDRVINNVETARNAIREILASETTVEVADSAYGLVMAATEYLDHVRRYNTKDTLLGRQLLGREPLKAKAAALAREVATVG